MLWEEHLSENPRTTFQVLSYVTWAGPYSTSLGLSFLLRTSQGCSTIAGVLPGSTLLWPAFSTVYLIQSYDRVTGDTKKEKKKNPKKPGHGSLGKRGLRSLFVCKILVVFIKLIFLKAGACFSSLHFPSLLAGYKCLQSPLAPHKFFPLWSALPSCQIPLASDQLLWHTTPLPPTL